MATEEMSTTVFVEVSGPELSSLAIVPSDTGKSDRFY
jgi:hypothetical protein